MESYFVFNACRSVENSNLLSINTLCIGIGEVVPNLMLFYVNRCASFLPFALMVLLQMFSYK